MRGSVPNSTANRYLKLVLTITFEKIKSKRKKKNIKPQTFPYIHSYFFFLKNRQEQTATTAHHSYPTPPPKQNIHPISKHFTTITTITTITLYSNQTIHKISPNPEKFTEKLSLPVPSSINIPRTVRNHTPPFPNPSQISIDLPPP